MESNIITEVPHVDQIFSKWTPPRLSTLLTDDLEGHTTPRPEGRTDRPVIFHFMRHAQAYSNVGELEKRAELRDPKLTSDGIRQCEQVRTVVNSNRNIQQIYCSPMTRTIETTLITFRDILKSMKNRGIQTVAWDELREWGSIPCCTGTPLSILKEKFGRLIDFGLIKPYWEYNQEIYGDKCRAADVKESLFKIARNVQELTRRGLISDVRDGDLSVCGEYYVPYEIAIVSHGSFLETMLEAELGGEASHFPYSNCFHNANIKSFFFETINSPGGIRYEFTETEESKRSQFSRGQIRLD